MSEQLLRDVHASLAIRFGTTAPYALGSIRVERVGFAGIPCVTVPVSVPQRDMDALVPIARQHVYRWLAERQVAPEAVAFTPTVGGSYRRRKFTDENSSSPSHGRQKFGCQLEYRFEMTPALAAAVQWRSYSYGTLPAIWEGDR